MNNKDNIKNFLSLGNSKLPKDTAIFNMNSASNCPSAKLGYCQLKCSNDCYALKAERQYPSVKPYRDRQEDYFDNRIDCKQFANNMTELNKRKRVKIQKLRISEAGDFKDQNAVNKIQGIANNLKAIKPYVYTARRDLDYTEQTKLNINASGFFKSGINNVFIAVDSYQDKEQLIESINLDYATSEDREQLKTFSVKKCIGDCKICSLCANSTNNIIQVIKH